MRLDFEDLYVMSGTEVIEARQSAVTAPVNAPANSPMEMMMAAMQRGASLEQISQIMDLQERWQKAEAKKAYDAAFAAFKAESVKIIRNKSVSSGPLSGRSYAELHDWVNAVTPALSKHGLSSSWKLTKDEKDLIEITCYLRHVGGHEESVSMSGQPDAGGAKNSIQARASTMSYLERYTLKAITGLSEQNDDTDGNAPEDTELGDYWVSKMAQADTIEIADAVWKEGCSDIDSKDSLSAFKAFRQAYNDKKKILKGEG